MNMKKITGLLLGSYVLLGGLATAAAEEPPLPPKVLTIAREFVNRVGVARYMRRRRALSCKPWPARNGLPTTWR